jgi:signal transduction histidine kinase
VGVATDSDHPDRVERARLPDDEAKRLAALREIDILDTPNEAAFDDIARIASSVCGVPIALVSLVDADRQWFKARVGLAVQETPRDLAFCAHAILDDDVFVVHDAMDDRRFFDNPLVTGGPEIRFYAGAPLSLPSGDRVGTLCLIDRVARTLTPEMRETLIALKNQAEVHLALRARAMELKRANAALLTLQTQKEQLVQFVVHDMKNALAALRLNAESMVMMSEPSSEEHATANDIVDAAAHLARMSNDMLDIAGAELGSALRAQVRVFRIATIVDEVATTFAAGFAAAGVTFERTGGDLDLRGDPYLLRRVLENLVANAVRFAPRGSTVRVEAERRAEVVHVRVVDEGPGIPEGAREAIFDLYRTHAGARTNYGIGLAFCRAAVTAQQGRIWVEANQPRGTRFVVELPAA